MGCGGQPHLEPEVDAALQAGIANERVPLGGTKELSPVPQHWVGKKGNLSAVGTAEQECATNGGSVVPTGLGLFIYAYWRDKRCSSWLREREQQPYDAQPSVSLGGLSVT